MKLKKLIASVLALTLLAGCSAAKTGDPTATPTEIPTEVPGDAPIVSRPDVEIGKYGENEVTLCPSYAITDADPYAAPMTDVVAVDAQGNAVLTNADIQIPFWIEFFNFMSQYGDYASMFGLDSTVSLSTQSSIQEGWTWEQYFLQTATLRSAQNYALSLAAADAGYTLSAEDEAQIADVTDPEGNFIQEAEKAGYDTVDAYIQANFGAGTGATAYQDYMRSYYMAYNFANALQQEAMAAVTEEDVEARYTENQETYNESGMIRCNNVTVRHILIAPEGEKDEESGDWSEAAWADAEVKANDIYSQWQANPTEDNFAQLATEHTDDTGSAENGGLYEDFKPGDMVASFNDWCFDAARIVGDHGIVKSEFGYHIMYYVGQTETRAWYDTIVEEIVNEKVNAQIEVFTEKYPLKFDFAQIWIYDTIAATVTNAENTQDGEMTTDIPTEVTEAE